MPGSTDVVTCGRYQQTRAPNGDFIGRFVYGRSYRARPDAVPLDPFTLPISDITYETTDYNGIFGALRDASPDAWGRMVIERATGRSDLWEIDYLLASPDDRAGALSFGDSATAPTSSFTANRVLHLSELVDAAERLDDERGGSTSDDPVAAARLLLEHQGTTMGGARPKGVLEDDGVLWIAKFPQRSDRWNNAAVEGALLALAGRCGIRVPAARVIVVGGRPVLLVERFDRAAVIAPGTHHAQAFLRHRMISACTILRADDRGTDRTRWSYLDLADELQRWSGHPADDERELFLRMAFNALVSNLDDHPRNHAVVAPTRDWRLAPAFDITPQPSPGRHERDLAMTCGNYGRRACRANLISAASRFGLNAEEAEAQIDTLRAIIARDWEREIRARAGTSADVAAVAPAIMDEGFEYAVR